MFPYIGLAKIPDPNIADSTTSHKLIPAFFNRLYTGESIMEFILLCLADRKLSYNAVVEFLKYNRPEKFKNDPEEFLYRCFDEDTGKFTKGCVAWLLYKVTGLQFLVIRHFYNSSQVGVFTPKYSFSETKKVVEDLGIKTRITTTVVTTEGKEPDVDFLFPSLSADQLARSRDALNQSLRQEQEQPRDEKKTLLESVDDLVLTMSFMSHECSEHCSCWKK